jgi:hypothetical protein
LYSPRYENVSAISPFSGLLYCHFVNDTLTRVNHLY